MRQTILLADDSPTIQRLVAQTFAEGNFEVISVSNGEAAIRRFDETKPDIVLADIYMPGRSGYEVCSYVRNHPQLSSTPVILLVGAFDAFDEETAKNAGATANITKPFEARALIDLVESVVGERSASESELKLESATAPAAAPAPAPTPAEKPKTAGVAAKKTAPAEQAPPGENDILGLSAIFTPEPARSGPSPEIGEAEVERIAERVMQKISAQAVESVAWDVVPDIAEKVIRDTLKKNN